ncbi:unnamed protein product [Cuscuta europaea]|uniref:Uncharacterized protein n=1 Tax=Cuscuta europaea TaxID=41803 RepID=A0A9P0ZB96_CUSEU|nr:unnamed protein product [Cuscuta europaea]
MVFPTPCHSSLYQISSRLQLFWGENLTFGVFTPPIAISLTKVSSLVTGSPVTVALEQ